ncbi:MAG TPA: DUF721 domain-containing protein [Capsulimonadaceae bacterium]|jgi:hypothetical protein
MLKRGGYIQRFGDALESTLRENELKEPLRPRTALAIWADVVGPDIAAATTPETVREGVLFVRVRSNVWSNELTFYKSDILTRLNKRLGGTPLRDIHFKTTGPKHAPVVPESPPKVGPSDDELRSVHPEGHLVDIARRRSLIQDTDADIRLRTTASRIARTMEWKRQHGWIECVRCKALYEPEATGKTPELCPLCRTLRRVSQQPTGLAGS